MKGYDTNHHSLNQPIVWMVITVIFISWKKTPLFFPLFNQLISFLTTSNSNRLSKAFRIAYGVRRNFWCFVTQHSCNKLSLYLLLASKVEDRHLTIEDIIWGNLKASGSCYFLSSYKKKEVIIYDKMEALESFSLCNFSTILYLILQAFLNVDNKEF